MPMPKKGVDQMSDIAHAGRLSPDPLRFIFPRHTRKKIAVRFRVSLDTAKSWLRDGVPRNRRQDLARIVTAELDDIEAEIRRIRESGER